MNIENVIERIKDLGVIASEPKEYEYLEKEFIKNFNNEYEIVEKNLNKIDIFKAGKGELINFCLKNDKRIREIDSAIPLVISKELAEFGLDRSFMVTAYWKNGEIEILNILQHYIFVKNSL